MNNNRKNWTKDNEAFLMTMARKGVSVDIMSSALGRNRGSVYQRIKMIERDDKAEDNLDKAFDIDMQEQNELAGMTAAVRKHNESLEGTVSMDDVKATVRHEISALKLWAMKASIEQQMLTNRLAPKNMIVPNPECKQVDKMLKPKVWDMKLIGGVVLGVVLVASIVMDVIRLLG